MAYLGRKGASAALTSADIPDDSITASKIASGAITAADVAADMATQAELDLKAPLASPTFTGTIGGGAIGSAVTGFAGIKHYSQWVITSGLAGSDDPIENNLAEYVDTGYTRLGDAMTQSSGVFTFPATGLWQINFLGECYYNGNARYNIGTIHVTSDADAGSPTWTAFSRWTVWLHAPSNGYNYANGYCSALFDVAGTSTHKVKFQFDTIAGGAVLAGEQGNFRTGFIFMRIGDT